MKIKKRAVKMDGYAIINESWSCYIRNGKIRKKTDYSCTIIGWFKSIEEARYWWRIKRLSPSDAALLLTCTDYNSIKNLVNVGNHLLLSPNEESIYERTGGYRIIEATISLK